MFEKLSKKARNLKVNDLLVFNKGLKGTFWEKQIQENREFYGWLENKVYKFLEAHSLE